MMDRNPSQETQRNVWEPRENRGRLRHCDGLQAPQGHWSSARPGRRERGLRPASQDTGLAVLVVAARRAPAAKLLRQREGWDQTRPRVRTGTVKYLHSHLAGV